MRRTKKQIIVSCIVFISMISWFILDANGIACRPRWNGTRTVEATCDFPASAMIYGDIIVGPYTVTVPNWVTLGLNMATYKATFTTGKIMFTWTAKMDASVTNRYSIWKTYSNGAFTQCDPGMQVLNAALTWFAPSGSLSTVWSSGTMYCAWP